MDEDAKEGEDISEPGDEVTAEKSGPAAAAKAAKKGVIPKEDDLTEVKGDDDE